MKTFPLVPHRCTTVSPSPLISQTAHSNDSRQGRPLDEETRRTMEDLFDADFADVRVHVGAEADAIGALAFAWGSHLFFAPETYQPETRAGRHLLAHELTHVLQQRVGRAGVLGEAGMRLVLDPALEAEAEHMGRRAAGRRIVLSSRHPANRVTTSAQAPVAGSVIQPRLQIESGPGAGYYDLQNLRALLDAVAVVINSEKYQYERVSRGPLEMVRGKLSHVGATDAYRFATLEALAIWMLRSTTPTPRANDFAPVYRWDAPHGSYHFIAKPTESKTAWDYSLANARTLMETEMDKHLAVLCKESSVDVNSPETNWYVVGDAPNNVGRYYKAGERNGLPTQRFGIQLTVNVRENYIEYHGYPDQRAQNTGVGKTRSAI